ncbi:hypothetical protein AAMO2058_000627900 [Amorphochlora amoebiformis]
MAAQRAMVLGSGVTGLSLCHHLRGFVGPNQLSIKVVDEGRYENGRWRGEGERWLTAYDMDCMVGMLEELELISSLTPLNPTHFLFQHKPYPSPLAASWVPNTIFDCLTSPLAYRLIPSLLREPWVRTDLSSDVEIGHFIARRFGHELPLQLADAYLAFLFNATIWDSSASNPLIQTLRTYERRYGSSGLVGKMGDYLMRNSNWKGFHNDYFFGNNNGFFPPPKEPIQIRNSHPPPPPPRSPLGLWGLKGGMDTLTEHLAAKLLGISVGDFKKSAKNFANLAGNSEGSQILTGVRVESLECYEDKITCRYSNKLTEDFDFVFLTVSDPISISDLITRQPDRKTRRLAHHLQALLREVSKGRRTTRQVTLEFSEDSEIFPGNLRMSGEFSSKVAGILGWNSERPYGESREDNSEKNLFEFSNLTVDSNLFPPQLTGFSSSHKLTLSFHSSQTSAETSAIEHAIDIAHSLTGISTSPINASECTRHHTGYTVGHLQRVRDIHETVAALSHSRLRIVSPAASAAPGVTQKVKIGKKAAELFALGHVEGGGGWVGEEYRWFEDSTYGAHV